MQAFWGQVATGSTGIF